MYEFHFTAATMIRILKLEFGLILSLNLLVMSDFEFRKAFFGDKSWIELLFDDWTSSWENLPFFNLIRILSFLHVFDQSRIFHHKRHWKMVKMINGRGIVACHSKGTEKSHQEWKTVNNIYEGLLFELRHTLVGWESLFKKIKGLAVATHFRMNQKDYF